MPTRKVKYAKHPHPAVKSRNAEEPLADLHGDHSADRFNRQFDAAIASLRSRSMPQPTDQLTYIEKLYVALAKIKRWAWGLVGKTP